ncbi:peptide chain release factor 2 [Neobacillus terrae]|uniref:peptide chain release factor 2 n=1 Tax=Neobacillus terrae TaxID=3034837 RepID=UPI001408589D|nr:peptide chain release factor 2 [Neobacillus terrae]NHM29941.1 peptide chain release factor 2 [Neobacillus terrae]
MELAQIRNELEKSAKILADFRGSLDLENKEARIAELDDIMLQPDFWNDQQAAQTVISESNSLKDQVVEFKDLYETYENIELTYELVKEESDAELQEELETELAQLTERLNQFELNLLLSGEYDRNNAILELHPGAGGTESQDWGSMLLRMYTRWGEKRGFKVETLDYLPGDEAGIKSVTLSFKGHNAYGYLKAEKGVHRLVRISPFDSSGRRHTSFVSCEVMPELNDDIEIDIRTEDLKIDTYRATGAGGQHINTTDSAVRITHMPTGVVVSCQTERSQIKNRETAMKMLKAKLYQREIEEKEKKLAEIRGEQKEIGWGSQIRSYVFHPYSMVKDHRTNTEVGNLQAVMDGDIDVFINAYLRSKLAYKEEE